MRFVLYFHIPSNSAATCSKHAQLLEDIVHCVVNPLMTAICCSFAFKQINIAVKVESFKQKKDI